MYLPEDGELHATDPVLSLIQRHRRPTLIATRRTPGTYGLDICLQGKGEAAFLDV